MWIKWPVSATFGLWGGTHLSAYSARAAVGPLARQGAFEVEQTDMFPEKTGEEEVIWNWCASTDVKELCLKGSEDWKREKGVDIVWKRCCIIEMFCN